MRLHISSTAKYVIILVFIAIATVSGIFLLQHEHKHVVKNNDQSPTGCISRTISSGNSGSCVSDIQTMVNFMETDGLSECPFSGQSTLPVSGSYDAATEKQVSVVQQWENCYNHQEGSTLTIQVNGTVSTPTWSELCTYAYQYPQKSGSSVSPYRQESISAGNNAGCTELY